MAICRNVSSDHKFVHSDNIDTYSLQYNILWRALDGKTEFPYCVYGKQGAGDSRFLPRGARGSVPERLLQVVTAD